MINGNRRSIITITKTMDITNKRLEMTAKVTPSSLVKGSGVLLWLSCLLYHFSRGVSAVVS